MINYCQENLSQIRSLLELIDDSLYVRKSSFLNNSSIGAHVRHILEFYSCVLRGVTTNQVCYDDRKRDENLETDRKFAIYTIDKISSKLNSVKENTNIILVTNFSVVDDNLESLNSSLYREFAYGLEHSIHHQALIVVALKEFNMDSLVPDGFGVASSTLRYKNQCVQ